MRISQTIHSIAGGGSRPGLYLLHSSLATTLVLMDDAKEVWILTKDPPATPEGGEGVTLSLCNNRSPQSITSLLVILSWRPLGNLGRRGVR